MISMFPKGKSNQLNNEHEYLIWVIQMHAAFDLCGLLELIDGSTTKPISRHVTEATWKKMNALAKKIKPEQSGMEEEEEEEGESRRRGRRAA